MVPSTSKPWMVRVSDPAAMITAPPVTSNRSPPSLGSIETVRPAAGAVPVVDVDLAPLQQLADAADQLVDHRLLALLGDRPVERGLAGVDAERRRLGHRAVHVGGLEQLLGGDAAHVQAGPPIQRFSTRAMLSPARRRTGPRGRRAAADDDDVEVIGRGDHLQGSDVGRYRRDSTGRGRPGRSGRSGGRHREKLQSTSATWTLKATRMASPQRRAAMINRRVLMEVSRLPGTTSPPRTSDRATSRRDGTGGNDLARRGLTVLAELAGEVQPAGRRRAGMSRAEDGGDPVTTGPAGATTGGDTGDGRRRRRGRVGRR